MGSAVIFEKKFSEYLTQEKAWVCTKYNNHDLNEPEK
jgi:hypothetical protein